MSKAVLHHLSEQIQSFIWPEDCVVCGSYGSCLCESCKAKLTWISQAYACRFCGAPFGYISCTECAQKARYPWISALEFDSSAANMVVRLKDQHDFALAPVMAECMYQALLQAATLRPELALATFDGICYVPATHKAYRRRNFDHMELVAQSFSRMSGLGLLDIVSRREARDQRELTRTERAENLRSSICVHEDVFGRKLLVLDDVITSGATMREVLHQLARRGAKELVGLSLARVGSACYT